MYTVCKKIGKHQPDKNLQMSMRKGIVRLPILFSCCISKLKIEFVKMKTTECYRGACVFLFTKQG